MKSLNYYLNQLDQNANQLHQVMINASHALNEFYLQPDSWELMTKSDQSPVTTADHYCHKLITQELDALNFNIPVVSEECTLEEFERFQHDPPLVYWLIDPLDGTTGFVKGTGHFAINVALIYETTAVAGWIAWPRVGLICWAYGETVYSSGSLNFPVHKAEDFNYLQTLREHHKLVVYSSTSANRRKIKVVKALQELLQDAVIVDLGAAIKFCAMFKGYGDLYPRLGGTCLWDLAAGQVLLRARGGDIYCLNGQPMKYDLRLGIYNAVFLAVAHADIKQKNILLSELKYVYNDFAAF